MFQYPPTYGTTTNGWTPIHWAAKNVHTKFVEILAPLTDNPNAASNAGDTPIHLAAKFGPTEIVKILSLITDNPNAPDKDGETPIYLAEVLGRSQITQILAPLTPMSVAQKDEICRVLESFKISD